MNERERFLTGFQSLIANYLERIERMSEAQVENQLRACQAVRNAQNETLAFLSSVSLPPPRDRGDELYQLHSQLNAPARADLSPSQFSDHIQQALKKRLERLRKNRG